LKNSLLMPELSQMEKTISEMNSILAMEWPFDNIQNLAKLVIDAREVESAIETKTREKAEISINSSWDKIQKEAEEALKKEYQKPNTKVDIQNFYSDEKGFFEKLRGLLSDSEKVDSARVKASEEVGKFRDHLASLISIDQAESSEKPIKQIKKKAVRSSDLIPVANRQIKSKKDVDELVQNIKDSLEKYLDDNDEVDID
jgi:tRNA nucleotidyltransferase/poly(A) polymerase